MCPACLTTGALIAAGASSAGGLSAIVAKLFRSTTRSASVNAARSETHRVGVGAAQNDSHALSRSGAIRAAQERRQSGGSARLGGDSDNAP